MDRRRFVFAAAAVYLSSCDDSGIDSADWTEEVKLHDGQLLQVWRQARAHSNGFPNARRGADIDFELKYEPMQVHWRGEWNRDPVSFEIFDGVPHLALYIKDRSSCARKNAADYSAEFLQWKEGAWVEVPQAEFPTDKALMNLSGDYWGHTSADDYRGLVKWNDKRLRGSPNDTIASYFERGNRFCTRNRKRATL